jgi:hypothetical protein
VGRWKAVDGNAAVEFTTVMGSSMPLTTRGCLLPGFTGWWGQDGIQFEIRHGEADTEIVDARIPAGRSADPVFPGENASETYERIP